MGFLSMLDRCLTADFVKYACLWSENSDLWPLRVSFLFVGLPLVRCGLKGPKARRVHKHSVIFDELGKDKLTGYRKTIYLPGQLDD